VSFSATARLVALGVHCEARAGRARDLPAATCRLAARATQAWLRSRAAEAVLRRLEAWLLPGIAAHYVARKTFVWQAAQQAVAGGATRAVVLAPGCDGIGPALAELGVDVVELVHPHEARAREYLASGERAVTRVVADVADTVAVRRLADDPRPTLWIAEAVLMYVDRSAVCALVHDVLGARSTQTLVFSAMVPRADGTAGFGEASPWVTRWLAAVREPFRWALAPMALRQALTQAGFDAVDSANEVASPGFCAGEAVFTARRSR
jgi:O-methyltransferase involved in polyketide biosynthesis